MTLSYLQASIEEAIKEMRELDYNQEKIRFSRLEFSRFIQWIKDLGVNEFGDEVFDEYSKEQFGSKLEDRNNIRSHFCKRRAQIRLLRNYLKNGDLKSSNAICRKEFTGRYSLLFNDYLESQKRNCRANTISYKHYYLYVFSQFIEKNKLDLLQLTTEQLERFFKEIDKPLASLHAFRKNVRTFLRYLYDTEKTDKDLSINVLNDNYRGENDCPTVIDIEDFKKKLSLIDVTKPKGMRDYAIILATIELGLRPSDIVSLKFSDIKWDESKIIIRQVKTGNLLELPLTVSLGNAIIRYLRDGRPQSNIDNIFVSHEPFYGKALKYTRVTEIIRNRVGNCDVICGEKQIGARILRSTLASSILHNGGKITDVSEILGHKSVETAKHYIGIDFEALKKCALPIPVVKSTLYAIKEEQKV